ncbi:glycosyltransferase [Fibrella sp. HMF5335]|uniref:Glycosyltransferase n=1 Tax=Fibrella rubiginis TaxID=2817060 RepID=A0A939GI77_9BACT|nr:glycosyltransferase [Fibrella rubiginis]MBO0937940.1 glycosyltransferase [Fibrella rubiginis]
MVNSPKQMRIAACVTLYNSLPSCADALATYQDQVERVYLIDNSEKPDQALITQLIQWPTVQYLSNEGNLGVGAALNRAARQALADGFDYLLTMDDDTALPRHALATMIRFVTDTPDAARIGIVTGVHTPPKHVVASRAVAFTMTSGNLLSLSAYKLAGPFRDDFFIDHIDHEYGLRLNQAGFKVIELPGILLQHQLGEHKATGLGKRQFISHAPLRGYYIARNGWALARLYPAFRTQAAILISKEWLKALLFENKKGQRISLLWRGLRDAWRGKLGKLSM